jgi:hypothetical protein
MRRIVPDFTHNATGSHSPARQMDSGVDLFHDAEKAVSPVPLLCKNFCRMAFIV